ncbi:hypothetical protein RDI58_008807 [Solanum bulbocastanum]|uniref:CCHC-type domain-containing protein n=1 Tax=Solanum bulbocastanum TaxID=147425 RepID=A0AAN8YIW3_SOLBU
MVPLLEFVRKTIEAWNEKHNEKGRNTTTTLTSKYNEMMEDNRNLSHRMLVRASTIHLHTITDGAKSNKNYQDTYAIPIDPLPCESTWDVPSHVLEEVVLPPITRKQLGRPPKNDRKKEFTEGKGKKRKVTCRECGIVGHNKKTCPKKTRITSNLLCRTMRQIFVILSNDTMSR